MKRLLSIVVMMLLLTKAFPQDIEGIINSKPKRLVNDHSQVLTKDEVSKLEKKLVSFDKRTSTQIAVVLLKTLDGHNLEETTQRIFNSWGIGQKEKNNGLLILAAINDRKIRIEVGDGLTGRISNDEAAGIIRNDIGPSFKQAAYFEGLDKATNSLMNLALEVFPDTANAAVAPVNGASPASGEQATPAAEKPSAYDYEQSNVSTSDINSGLGLGFNIAIVILVIIILVLVLKSIFSSRSNTGGTYSSSGYNPVQSRSGLFGSVFGGLLGGWFFSNLFNNQNRDQSGRSDNNNDSNKWSGFSGGSNGGMSNDSGGSGGGDFGGFGGGSSSGGDFGGSSGGSSSGGGASGGW